MHAPRRAFMPLDGAGARCKSVHGHAGAWPAAAARALRRRCADLRVGASAAWHGPCVMTLTQFVVVVFPTE
jgi:hypothetical protein